MGAVCSSAADAAPLPPPHVPPAAEGQGGGDDDNDDFSPLLDLVERFPDLFEQKVLAHLDPIDRTFLAQTAGACRAAVAASDLPRAGTREEVMGRSVWVVTHKVRQFVGSVARLAWAKASGCPWSARTSEVVAWGGRLEVLQWAWERECPWGVGTCYEAAQGGHREVLKWAQAHQCPYDKWTPVWATYGGYMEVVRWARARLPVGCQWDNRSCVLHLYNYPEMQAWVRAQH
jgi:hypothetical protein